MVPPAAIAAFSTVVAQAAATAAPELSEAKLARFVDTIVGHCTAFVDQFTAHTPPTTPTPPKGTQSRGNTRRALTVSPSSQALDIGAHAPPDEEALGCLSRQSPAHLQPPVMVHEVRNCSDAIISDYVVLGSLGRGSPGNVKLVVHSETDEVFAVHVLDKSLLMRITKGDGMTALTQVQQEVAIMKKLNHRNVVKMHEVIDDPEKNKMYIVMDYVAGGQLFELEPQTGACPVMPVHEIRGVMRQLCAGLMYLHRHGIVHRDIKPDNILIDRTTGSVFLSDFGVSLKNLAHFDAERTTSPIVDDTTYMAPEMYRVDAATSELDGECLDVWAWGVTLYCMLYGKHPFMARTVAEARDRIVGDDLTFPREPPTADAKRHQALWHALVDLLETMLHRDPARRATMKDVRAALRAMKPVQSLPRTRAVAREGSLMSPVGSEVSFKRSCADVFLPHNRAWAFTPGPPEILDTPSRLSLTSFQLPHACDGLHSGPGSGQSTFDNSHSPDIGNITDFSSEWVPDDDHPATELADLMNDTPPLPRHMQRVMRHSI